ncbi:siderophore-interacting protein [Streptomyces sp. NBC_00378]|uniref:siderophore-interacting protein n=1 Tax=unclassified Streptomyces TaxID=2593676 RepID=UPI0022534F9B|nr:MULTISPECIES: siderophore-interacting protein [unclassified Streptomyces]MCX5109756.1 siderophore-interacting protein [Streptomyces sp. NBC_00378]
MGQALTVSYVRVVGVERITPRTARVTFTGDALAGLMEDRPDQQMKLCFPREGQGVPRLPEPEADDTYGMRWYEAYIAIPEPERPLLRSFTVRAYDRGRDVMTVDFVLHGDDGPAARWGRDARAGDVLGMVGPSSLYARPLPAADWLLLAGDESALPAIATLLESLPAGARALVCAEVADATEERPLDSAGEVSVHWVHRDGGGSLADAVRAAPLPAGTGAAWLAGEAGAVRALRRHLIEERGLHRAAVQFSGYWRRSLTQDDAPTEEDLAWAKEQAGE